MNQTDIQTLKSAIQARWPYTPSAKAKAYLGQFFKRTRTGKKIVAKVNGNYGVYTVSIEAKAKGVQSACSCYIGKGGFCHHCEALAHTFLQEAESFQEIRKKSLQQLRTPDKVQSFLSGRTLDTLIQDLKAKGIAQKDFAEMIGMNPRHLSAIKSSELQNRFFNELGATKLACLWVLEHLKK
ncbi:MAG: hypothetical protein ICV53_09775 [Flavisolibacter sp.]|nr:hypothetical protein [Flavisolibacter sp.]